MNEVPIERLHEVLTFDREAGALVWLKPTSRKVVAGSRVGAVRGNGYRSFNIDGVRLQEHRAVFAMHTGRWPGPLDHRNLIRDDNRLSNLREATPTQNNVNTRARSTNKTGFKGVSFCNWSNRYRAVFCRRTLGRFDTPEEAHAAYADAAIAQFGEFARLS